MITIQKLQTMFGDTLLLTKHWHITTTCAIFEIMLPNGEILINVWDNNHKLIEKLVWNI